MDNFLKKQEILKEIHRLCVEYGELCKADQPEIITPCDNLRLLDCRLLYDIKL